MCRVKCDEMNPLKFENPKAEGYRDLVVWQKGVALAKLTYTLTKSFPADEKFGLISQMRRASVSIPSNIAEGQARHTTGEFILFISHAEGSVAELDTQLQLAMELGFTNEEQAASCLELLGEPRRMLNGPRRKLGSAG
jgi:four helix bundle protein